MTVLTLVGYKACVSPISSASLNSHANAAVFLKPS